MPGAWQPAAGWTAGGRLPLRLALRWLLLVAIALAAMGCAINPRIDLEEIAAESEPLLLRSVPFYPQTAYQCGPAALAGVLGGSGVEITPDELTPQVYLPERKGSLQVELLAATRRAGRVAYVLDPDVDALLGEVRTGRPVLVFQNLRTRQFPVWHYAVLVGFDPAGNEVYLNSGKRERMEARAPTFLRTWDWAGRWAMVALKPGELPSSPDALSYFQAVAAFEAVAGDGEAVAAWQAAARRWPEDYRPLFALGNAAYRAGDYPASIRHFRQALQLNPGEAVVQNNLAEALAAGGCPRAAERRLASFMGELASDSPWREDLAATLDGIRAKSGDDLAQCAQLGSH